MKTFVLASANPHKRSELEALLRNPEWVFASVTDRPGFISPAEDGNTLADNARIKAAAALAHTGLPAIADDTGLEVDALGGRPGVHTARYAGPEADPAGNIARLLRELDEVPEARRTARFHTVCLALLPDRRMLIAEGVLDGRITREPRGWGGFGYDPVFEVPELGRTLAELDPATKNELSHRGRAARRLREALEHLT